MSLSDPDLPIAWLTDPLVASLPAEAFRVHALAHAWCWQHDSDGLLPYGALAYCGRNAGRERVLRRLTRDGLWEEKAPEGYHVTDYLVYQVSGARRRQLREQGRARTARYRGGSE